MKDKTLIDRRELLKTGGIVTAGSLLTPTVLDVMGQQPLGADNNLKIGASKTSSQSDFSFYPGKWKIRERRLKTRLKNGNDWKEYHTTEEVRKILNGLGYVGQYRATFNNLPFEGMALHLFDPATKLWSNYWVDSSRGVMEPVVVGSFENKIGTFYGKDTFENKPIDVMFRWDITDANNPVWSQAFSADGGKTWETNAYFYYSKITE